MAKEKPRMADHWEVKYAVCVGGHEVVFAEDQRDQKHPYFIGDCSYENPFGVPEYKNCIGTSDYLETVAEFANRIKTQAELVRQTRAERGISDLPLTRDACLSGGLGDNIEGKLVVIRPEIMQDDKRTADYQYFVAEYGNGCRAEALGLGVFGQNLYTGKRGRWERSDILGIADPEKLPEWAKDRLKALQSEKETSTRPRKKTEMER
jgi:hypothetical protein